MCVVVPWIANVDVSCDEGVSGGEVRVLSTELCRNGLVVEKEVVIVCHEKVVRKSLEGGEILRVQVPGATPVAKSPYRLAPSKMQEWSEQLQELQDKGLYDLVIFRGEHQCRLLRRGAWSSFKVRVGIIKEGEVSNVKDKILATPSEISKVENAPAEMLRDLDQQMEKRADDGKANVVTDALSRKERVKPRRVRAMAMTIQYGVRGMILTAQSEAFKQENVPLVGSEIDEAHASRNGYLRKGRKTKPKRQNRTRNGKAWKRHSQVKAQNQSKSPAEQYIFHRRSHVPTETSGREDSTSLYAELGLSGSDTDSAEATPLVIRSRTQDEGHAGSDPGKQDKGQAGSNP
ncbi:hypothetical protein Tco_0488631 [Tanacetum coccineum]